MKTFMLRFRDANRDLFNDVLTSKKKVETRVATSRYGKIKAGDYLLIVCGKDRIKKLVKRVVYYPNLDSMFQDIGYKKILPSAISQKDARSIFNSFPAYKEKIKQLGILAFYI